MKRVITAIALAFILGIAQVGFSEENKSEVIELKEVQTKIKLVISDQINAFTRSDLDRAYYHASKSIKLIFPNPEIFGSMVKTSYPMIWAPKAYQFLSVSQLPSGVVQKVMFTASNGRMHFFDYALENNGRRWVISGVYMVKGEEGV